MDAKLAVVDPSASSAGMGVADPVCSKIEIPSNVKVRILRLGALRKYTADRNRTVLRTRAILMTKSSRGKVIHAPFGNKRSALPYCRRNPRPPEDLGGLILVPGRPQNNPTKSVISHHHKLKNAEQPGTLPIDQEYTTKSLGTQKS